MGQFFPTTIRRFHDQSNVGNRMMDPDVRSTYTFGGWDSMDGAYSDPTYLGFRVLFQTASNIAQSELHYDYDSLPQGLLLNSHNAYSTQNYFYRMNAHKEQWMVEQFREGLFKVDKEMPWYIQSITGLDELYQMDPENNFRGNEKKITITFLEDVKMQMTYLFDLYRKSVWDPKYMRWKVPENMRKFGMEVYIVDIRNFQSTNASTGSDSLHNWDWFDPTRPMRAVDTMRGELKGALASVKSKILKGGGYKHELNEDQYYDPSNTRTAIERLPADDFLPILKLELDDCEFNLVQDGLGGFGDISNTVGADPREVSLDISIGNIREINQYTLFEIVLDDYGSMYDDLPTVSNEMYKVAKDMSKDDPVKTLINRQRKNPLLEKIKARALQEVVGRVGDKAKEFLNPFLLGNIYGLSPMDIRNTIDNVMKNDPDSKKSMPTNIGLKSYELPTKKPDKVDLESNYKKGKINDNIDLEGKRGTGRMPDNIDFDEEDGIGYNPAEKRKSLKEKPAPPNIELSGPPS